MELVKEKGCDFIIGERIKSLPASVQKSFLDKSNYKQEWICTENNEGHPGNCGEPVEIQRSGSLYLIQANGGPTYTPVLNSSRATAAACTKSTPQTLPELLVCGEPIEKMYC